MQENHAISDVNIEKTRHIIVCSLVSASGTFKLIFNVSVSVVCWFIDQFSIPIFGKFYLLPIIDSRGRVICSVSWVL
jgi:hypothetical protein